MRKSVCFSEYLKSFPGYAPLLIDGKRTTLYIESKILNRKFGFTLVKINPSKIKSEKLDAIAFDYN